MSLKSYFLVSVFELLQFNLFKFQEQKHNLI
jgi:hypothetical protein